MFWNLKKIIQEIDKAVFPNNSIPIKLVWRRPGWAPASYLTNTKDKRKKPRKEWYEVAIFTRRGNDLARACHEVRHRVQRYYPKMPLFTKDKLVQMKTKRAIDYLEAIGEVPPLEEDAIIIERLIVESPDPIKMTPLWIRQGADKIF